MGVAANCCFRVETHQSRTVMHMRVVVVVVVAVWPGFCSQKEVLIIVCWCTVGCLRQQLCCLD